VGACGLCGRVPGVPGVPGVEGQSALCELPVVFAQVCTSYVHTAFRAPNSGCIIVRPRMAWWGLRARFARAFNFTIAGYLQLVPSNINIQLNMDLENIRSREY